MATFASTAIALLALAYSKQDNKNLGRNIGIGGGAVLLHGLLTYNTTESIIGAAGAGAGAKMYEDNRKAQSRQQRQRSQYYYRSGRKYYSYNSHEYYLDTAMGARHMLN